MAAPQNNLNFITFLKMFLGHEENNPKGLFLRVVIPASPMVTSRRPVLGATATVAGRASSLLPGPPSRGACVGAGAGCSLRWEKWVHAMSLPTERRDFFSSEEFCVCQQTRA